MISFKRSNVAAMALTLSLSLAVSQSAFAHGDREDEHEKKIDYSKVDQHEFGRAADPALATRTVVVKMSDEMRFTPDRVEVARDEVVLFEIHNNGKLKHEMVLGTDQELKHHAEMMRKFPGMEHDELHMAHVAPARSKTMGWRFTNSDEYYYGCLIPGHFEAGMKGTIVVR